MCQTRGTGRIGAWIVGRRVKENSTQHHRALPGRESCVFGWSEAPFLLCMGLFSKFCAPTGKSLILILQNIVSTPSSEKYFAFPEPQISATSLSIPSRPEGRIMIATIVGRVAVDRGVLDPRMREDDCLARSHTIHVIASEAKQSISPHEERMDCFAALAMTVPRGYRSPHVHRRTLHPRLFRQDHPGLAFRICRPLRPRRRDPVRLFLPDAPIRQQHQFTRAGAAALRGDFPPRLTPDGVHRPGRRAGSAAEGGEGIQAAAERKGIQPSQ